MNESGAQSYECFVRDDSKTRHIYERYAASAAVVTQFDNFGARFAERFLDAVEPTRLMVYGNPSEEARGALADLHDAFMSPISGFSH